MRKVVSEGKTSPLNPVTPDQQWPRMRKVVAPIVAAALLTVALEARGSFLGFFDCSHSDLDIALVGDFFWSLHLGVSTP